MNNALHKHRRQSGLKARGREFGFENWGITGPKSSTKEGA